MEHINETPTESTKNSINKSKFYKTLIVNIYKMYIIGVIIAKKTPNKLTVDWFNLYLKEKSLFHVMFYIFQRILCMGEVVVSKYTLAQKHVSTVFGGDIHLSG